MTQPIKLTIELCPYCEGKRYVQGMIGDGILEASCPACEGSGVYSPEIIEAVKKDMNDPINNTVIFGDVLRNEYAELVAKRRAFPNCEMPLMQLVSRTNAVEGALALYDND